MTSGFISWFTVNAVKTFVNIEVNSSCIRHTPLSGELVKTIQMCMYVFWRIIHTQIVPSSSMYIKEEQNLITNTLI